MTLEVQERVPLAPLTTFGIGGAAEYFIEVKTGEELREAIRIATERNLPHTVLAGGSNVLVPDEGIRGVVIHIVAGEYSYSGAALTAAAGCSLLTLIRASTTKGLGGWEKLAGIPGTIGGAVRGNAGAFGTEIRDVASSVDALNSKTGEVREFTNAECEFSYRHSFFKDNPDWIVVRVTMQLKVMDASDSKRLCEETIAEREKRHLQNVKAAGSFFMNPVVSAELAATFEREKGVKAREGRVPAGWLIEKAGMKGAKIGGAIASLQHPNYIVNTGNASALDVRELAEKIKEAVKSQFDVELHEEAAAL